MNKIEFEQQAVLQLLGNPSVFDLIKNRVVGDLRDYIQEPKKDYETTLSALNVKKRAFAYYVAAIADEVASQVDFD